MGVLQSITRDPQKGVAGLCKVLLANRADVSIGIDASNYTAFADGDASIADAFTEFVMTKETSNWTTTGTGTPTAGTTVYNQVLTLVFARNEVTKVNQVKVMGDSELVAVAIDTNGNAWCLGNGVAPCNKGLDMTSSTGTSGTAPADLAGQTIVLSGNFAQPESYVTDASLAVIQPS